MIADIDIHRGEIVRLCRMHRVRRLEVFGSAADGTFDPQRSDIDFLVEFLPLKPGEYFDTFFDLVDSLEALLDRKVDLLDMTCLRNPYLVRGVNASRTVIYES